LNGVIYARYSSDNQREESIEGQLRECKEFAEKNGITILGTYIDRALSAKTDNRPEFQRMIKDSAKGLFDVVIVWKLDRFARNRYDSAHYKAVLRKNGVKVISARETIAEDSTGILLESLLEGYAEFYSAELSEKVIRGMTENALKCKYNGGGLPIGYVIDDEQHYQVDPLTAPFVLEAFKRYANGGTVIELVRWFNANGVQSYRKKPVRVDVMQRTLKNRAYLGEYHHSGHVVSGGMPAIVPEDLFERVQERLAKNKKAPARHKAEDDYLLTTKLFCGLCGAYMVGESGTSRTKEVHHYYKCVTVKKRGNCKKKTVRKKWIEDIVIDQALRILMDDALLDWIADTVLELQGRENTQLPLLRKQLADAEKGIDNMLDAIQQGIFNASTKKRLDELEAAKSEFEIQILQEEMQKPLLTKEQIIFWFHRFRGIDTSQREQRQRVIDFFINAVYLYDDRLVITFNYKDGSKTIMLEDIEREFSSDLNASGAPLRLTIRVLRPLWLVFCCQAAIATTSRILPKLT